MDINVISAVVIIAYFLIDNFSDKVDNKISKLLKALGLKNEN